VRWRRQLPFIPMQGSSSCRRRGFHGNPRYSVACSPFHRTRSLARAGGPARPWCTHAHYTYIYIYNMYTARALTNDRAGKIKQRVRDKTSSHIGSISRGRGILLYYILLSLLYISVGRVPFNTVDCDNIFNNILI